MLKAAVVEPLLPNYPVIAATGLRRLNKAHPFVFNGINRASMSLSLFDSKRRLTYFQLPGTATIPVHSALNLERTYSLRLLLALCSPQ